MKLISWNVNGLRACIQKGFLDFFNQANADFFCLQETKLQPGQLTLELPGYEQFWCYAEKKGYSGTAVFTRHTPMSVRYGLGIPELDTEGRLITLEYPEFFLVTCYTPNAQRELARIGHRLKWEEAFRSYMTELDSQKPVILCGDLNVAHQEIDLKNPASNRGSAGFSDQERTAFTQLLDSGFTDTFRYRNPEATGCYTWWSYMFNARKNNAGWRIDYFLVSDRLRENIYQTPIHSTVLGSDHCPVELDLDLRCNGSIWQTEPEGPASHTVSPLDPGTKKTLLSCAAVLLLGIGFAGGFLAGRLGTTQTEENMPDLNLSQPLSSYPVYIGSVVYPQSEAVAAITATRAKAMTTDRLISYVIQIPELIGYVDPQDYYFSSTQPILDPGDYAVYRQKYPVLAELASRTDASQLIRQRMMYSSDLQSIRVLSLLQTLDIFRQSSNGIDPRENSYSSAFINNNTVIIPVTPTGE